MTEEFNNIYLNIADDGTVVANIELPIGRLKMENVYSDGEIKIKIGLEPIEDQFQKDKGISITNPDNDDTVVLRGNQIIVNLNKVENGRDAEEIFYNISKQLENYSFK